MNPHDKVAHHLPRLFNKTHYDMIMEFMGKRPKFNPPHIQDLVCDSNNINNAIGFNIEWRTPELFDKLNCKSKCENNGKIMSWSAFLGS
jgi:hypothetical protein